MTLLSVHASKCNTSEDFLIVNKNLEYVICMQICMMFMKK